MAQDGGGEQVRIGIIGLGEVAQIIHLPILRSLPDRFRVTAICDVSPSLLNFIGHRYDIPAPARHADFHELVARDDVDAVLVLNSDEYHADCAIAAMRAGKHVLIEKPMCLTLREADAIIAERDKAGVQAMVGYMRRFAPSFLEAVEEVRRFEKISYARVRAIVGPNSIFINQSSLVERPDDIPAAAMEDRRERSARMNAEALGAATPELIATYRMLCGLNSHDLSAMRELLGFPRRVLAATHWNGGRYAHAILDYGDYQVAFETGTNRQARFDAQIEVFSPTTSVRIQYDTPYIRHLPTTLYVTETNGDRFTESVSRATYVDPYTHELLHFHDVVTGKAAPKTTPEDSRDDLRLFGMIINAIRNTQYASDEAPLQL